MTQLTVSTWNINQRSGLGRQIPDVVVTELRQLNADIICLTEYVKTESHNLFCARLQDIGYEVFEDDRSLEFGNEILVAIKSSLISDSKFTMFCFIQLSSLEIGNQKAMPYSGNISILIIDKSN